MEGAAAKRKPSVDDYESFLEFVATSEAVGRDHSNLKEEITNYSNRVTSSTPPLLPARDGKQRSTLGDVENPLGAYLVSPAMREGSEAIRKERLRRQRPRLTKQQPFTSRKEMHPDAGLSLPYTGAKQREKARGKKTKSRRGNKGSIRKSMMLMSDYSDLSWLRTNSGTGARDAATDVSFSSKKLFTDRKQQTARKSGKKKTSRRGSKKSARAAPSGAALSVVVSPVCAKESGSPEEFTSDASLLVMHYNKRRPKSLQAPLSPRELGAQWAVYSATEVEGGIAASLKWMQRLEEKLIEMEQQDAMEDSGGGRSDHSDFWAVPKGQEEEEEEAVQREDSEFIVRGETGVYFDYMDTPITLDFTMIRGMKKDSKAEGTTAMLQAQVSHGTVGALFGLLLHSCNYFRGDKVGKTEESGTSDVCNVCYGIDMAHFTDWFLISHAAFVPSVDLMLQLHKAYIGAMKGLHNVTPDAKSFVTQRRVCIILERWIELHGFHFVEDEGVMYAFTDLVRRELARWSALLLPSRVKEGKEGASETVVTEEKKQKEEDATKQKSDADSAEPLEAQQPSKLTKTNTDELLERYRSTAGRMRHDKQPAKTIASIRAHNVSLLSVASTVRTLMESIVPAKLDPFFINTPSSHPSSMDEGGETVAPAEKQKAALVSAKAKGRTSFILKSVGCSDRQLAEQLTIFFSTLYYKISTRELYQYVSGKRAKSFLEDSLSCSSDNCATSEIRETEHGDSAVESDSLQPLTKEQVSQKIRSKAESYRNMGTLPAMIKAFNALSFWVQEEILMESSAKARAKKITAFISLASWLYELNNFHGLMAVLSALLASTIDRLKKSWILVKPKWTELLSELSQIFYGKGNMKSYRELLKKQHNEEIPCVPFLGVMVSDMTMANEVRTYAGGSKHHLNFGKFESLGIIFRTLLRMQEHRYDQFEQLQSVQDYITCKGLEGEELLKDPLPEELQAIAKWLREQHKVALVSNIDEKMRYSMSVWLEPRASR